MTVVKNIGDSKLVLYRKRGEMTNRYSKILLNGVDVSKVVTELEIDIGTPSRIQHVKVGMFLGSLEVIETD